ncbi:hypothetical protein CR203_11465 [Salipaludibacillus neizhouensis]|uniref:DUF624 domain-containing protein n=1 Tax=Salipaludibacillus neizhouensis TaxID=885475 RepID=A0A3A9KBY1_9BACI|nr:YesL family protein [Salipaludibacillus neizhouensis]RKL67123.1 hypothetical protein CR203_11465 [Salipaludibacillus neizhouensis]
MEKNWTDTPLYVISDWLMRLAYINLLWILFTFLGGIVLGFMPATVAMFTIIRKLIVKDDQVPIFKTFTRVFKSEFLKSNILGVILGGTGYILYIDFLYLGSIEGYLHSFLSVALVLIAVCYVATVFIILPIYVQYDLKFSHYFKHAFYIALINPHIIIFMAVGVSAIYYVFNFLPGLTMFYFGSGFATLSLWCSLLAINRIERKKESLETA